MIKTHSTWLAIILLTSSLSLLGLGCKGGDPAAQKQAETKIILNWWRTQGSTQDFAEVIKAYQQIHPNISIKVTVIPGDQLEQRLLEALAAGRGPDLVSLLNSHLGSWQDKLQPLPATITLPFQEMRGLIKKEPTWVMQTNATLNPKAMPQLYVDTVVKDAIINNQIYGLPIALDSLLLYYNRDLLNGAQIATVPADWESFKTAVQKITQLDKNGKFLQYGAALGEGNNVPYAADILTALMLQNGTPMTNSTSSVATFAQAVKSGDQSFVPGQDALRFYTDFANPTKETYTWSAAEGEAWQQFASGKVGFIFGYWRDFAKLKQLAPKINLGVANFPQISATGRPVYLASYYLETVPKQSQHISEAWDLLQYLAQPSHLSDYLKNTKQPAAQRSLVADQLKNLDVAIPATQSLNAQSWYHGLKPDLVDSVFKNLIEQTVSGTDMIQNLRYAATQITQTLQNKK